MTPVPIRRLTASILMAISAVCGPLAPTARCQPPEESLIGSIIAVDETHVIIDIGSSELKGGDVGVIMRRGVQIGLASVLWVDSGHTNMRIVSMTDKNVPSTGDSVVFAAKESRPNDEPAVPAGAPAAEVVEPVSPSVGSAASGGESAEPKAGLLTAGTTETVVALTVPTTARKTALAKSANLFRGRVRYSQLYQTINLNDTWYSASRLDTDGSIERLFASRWSIAWAGNATRRDGKTFSTAQDYKHIQPHVYNLILSFKAADEGFLRLGRFYPSELSGLGYVDGVQAEHPFKPGFRIGAAAGTRPDRSTQEFSRKENVAAGYGTWELGTMRSFYHSGTLGLFRTYFDKRSDEFAALLDQRADLGPKFNLFSSAQMDFHGGGAVVRKHPRLTRLNVNANSPLTAWLSMRAGTNHYEPLDTAADRDLTSGSTLYLNNGYWRHWVGSAQTLPAGFQLDEDISFMISQTQWIPGQWRIGLSHLGLPGLPQASINGSVYNLYNPAGPDYGSTLSGSVPLLDSTLQISPNVSFRDGPTSTSHRRRRVTDVSVYMNWRVGTAWNFDAGASRSWQEQITGNTVNCGASYRW